MYVLNQINIMYTSSREEVDKIEAECYHYLDGKGMYYLLRVKKIVVGFATYLIVFALILVQGITTPSIISWIFLTLNLINMAFMIRGSGKQKHVKIQV